MTAPTTTTQQEVDAHRADLAVLAAAAANDLKHAVSSWTGAAAVRDGLLHYLPQLFGVYGSAAGTLGADWYDDLRDAFRTSGRFQATPAEGPPTEQLDVLARWSVSPLFAPAPSDGAALDPAIQLEKALANVQGGVQKLLADIDRDTVTTASIADPAAEGWQRAGAGACAFCRMLIGRGAVYTERSVRFASHDHCHCTAVPAFGGHPLPVTPYTPSNRDITAADRARVRKYIRDHNL